MHVEYFFRIHYYELFEIINVYSLKTQKHKFTFFSFIRILFCRTFFSGSFLTDPRQKTDDGLVDASRSR